MLVFIYFLLPVVTKCFGDYIIINSKLNNVTFKYPDDINGENDLHECKSNEACNVIYERFWTSSLTERLCRCPDRKECPWQWMKEPKNSSLWLNNKSYMKFCSPITKMNVCTRSEEAIQIYGKSDRNNNYLTPYNVTANCICPESHYWKLQKYTYEENDLIIQTFKCIKQRKCTAHEFCGHIRGDLYSTYYRCTCPPNHLCIFKDQNKENVQELLYSGPAYKAYCLPFKNM